MSFWTSIKKNYDEWRWCYAFWFHLNNLTRKKIKNERKEKKRENERRKNYFQVYCTFKFVDILTLTYMHIYKAYMPKLKVLFFCVCVYV